MDDLIQQAAAALRGGNKDEARIILTRAIKQDPNNERAWGWMYNAANSDQERIECLNQMLRINPKNEKAAQLLGQISNLEPPLEMPISRANVPIATPIPEKKKSSNSVLLISIISIVVLAVFCCSAISLSGSQSNQVKYKITGTAFSALVSYANAQGGMEQATVNLPYEKDMDIKPGVPLSLVAQNQGSGTITCEIWQGSTMTKTSTSTNQYGVVTCSDLSK